MSEAPNTSSRLRKTTSSIVRDTKLVEKRAVGLAEEFKSFILRGNVVDLAVGIVIGAAFTTIVNAFVKDFITQLIAAVGGKPDFSTLKIPIGDSGGNILIGDFINALVSFLIVAAVVFFFVVKPMNALLRLRKSEQEPPPEPTTRDCPYCLNAIPKKATRCGFCTSQVTAEA
jgi:large conductance mechanosensitive channel